MDSLLKEHRFNPIHKKFGYAYYEVSITKGTGDWKQGSKYQIELGFSHHEDPNCGKYLCKLLITFYDIDYYLIPFYEQN